VRDPPIGSAHGPSPGGFGLEQLDCPEHVALQRAMPVTGRKRAHHRLGFLSSRRCGQDRVRGLLRCIELGEVAGVLDQGHLAAPEESGKTACEGWI
jgi:hypothetical protein